MLQAFLDWLFGDDDYEKARRREVLTYKMNYVISHDKADRGGRRLNDE